MLRVATELNLGIESHVFDQVVQCLRDENCIVTIQASKASHGGWMIGSVAAPVSFGTAP